MRLNRRLIALGLTLATLAGCGQAPAQPAQPDAVSAWYDCVECTAAQRDAVRALGDAAVSEFRSTLINGPSDARRNGERQRLQKAYQAMKDYEKRHPENPVQRTEQQYVDAYLEQFVLRYRLRAAAALGAIGTPSARAALQEALQLKTLPGPLKREIDRALGSSSP